MSKITGNTDDLLDGYIEEKVDMSGFSGAPIVDATGRAIGIVTGPAGLFNINTERGFSGHSVLELNDLLKALKDGGKGKGATTN